MGLKRWSFFALFNFFGPFWVGVLSRSQKPRGFICDKKIEGGWGFLPKKCDFSLGARPKKVFYGFTEKYFGANGLSPGVSGSAIAYFEKNRAQKAREKKIEMVFIFLVKPEGGSYQFSKTYGVSRAAALRAVHMIRLAGGPRNRSVGRQRGPGSLLSLS